jgi:hypothetical protein
LRWLKNPSLSLFHHQYDLRKILKRRVISFAVLGRASKIQCARIKFLKEGDTNTKKIHTKVNACRRKNFIQRIANGEVWITDHEGKASLINNHFSMVMGKGPLALEI